jgi:hypothetical protein
MHSGRSYSRLLYDMLSVPWRGLAGSLWYRGRGVSGLVRQWKNVVR